MKDDYKSTPDELLASIQEAEARDRRGKLKVFFGMAPGVGKTYAMLEAASAERARGVDVVIGIVETHGRKETQNLLGDLPVIPRRRIEYRGTELEEFDLEAALLRNPSLILIDELAHTNAPGCRHVKRFQDVEELLGHGIDVYTTLNVQHLESRADTVRDITGVTVHETVPDSVLTGADCIQLVDITPSQLLTRLEEGKVYVPDRATAAMQNFFRESNLTALRELALRMTAERVDHELKSVRTGMQRSMVWRSGERLMVAVGPSPFSTRLVRWTRRMAYALDAPWIAIYVDTGEELSQENQGRLDSNLELARGLGAEVVVMPGKDIPETLLRMAHLRNVSQIVVGKPRQDPLFGFWHRPTLVDKLVRGSGLIDIYVVPAEPRTRRMRWRSWYRPEPSDVKESGMALAAVLLMTLIGWLAAIHLGYFAPAFLYLCMVVVLGFFIGPMPIFLAAALSAVLWDLLFIPPHMTFRIDRVENVMMFILFFIVAATTGRLTSRLRSKERMESERETRTNALFLFSRAVSTARSMDDIVQSAIIQIHQIFGAKMAIFTIGSEGRLALKSGADTYKVDGKEFSVADWCYKNRRSAGRFTETLPSSRGFYIPMLSGEVCMGVLGILADVDEHLSVAQRDLIENMASQLAMAIEREQLQAIQARARLMEESDKLHRALLDSVSHEFKTPLAVIEGVSEKLQESLSSHSSEVSDEAIQLCSEAGIAARRLRHLVRNLLDVTRIESGALLPKMDWCDVGDILECAMEATEEVRRGHPTRILASDELPLVRADFSLMEQALVNLLINACIHTPPGTPIDVSAGIDRSRREFVLEVCDAGPGIDSRMAEHIFDRFRSGCPGGLGLGLSIVKGFMEVQKGMVSLHSPREGGACFRLSLPWEEFPSEPK